MMETITNLGRVGLLMKQSKLIFFKIQNRSMITSIMDSLVLFFRMQSIKAQTRLKRLRTILP